MEIKLNILNYSKDTLDDKLKGYIENLFKELSNNRVNIDNIHIEYNNEAHYKMVKKFINENPKNRPLSNNDELLIALGYYYDSGERFVISGETLSLENNWGDAYPGWFTVISI